MPSISSYYCYPSTIDWTFNLDYEYDTCAQTCQNSFTCCKNEKRRCGIDNLLYRGSSWNFHEYYSFGDQMPYGVQGGNATLTWSSAQTNGSIKFQILGTHPSTSSVNRFLASYFEVEWYTPFLIKNTTFIQFDNNGYPLQTKDFGYGIYPRSEPSQTCDDIWSWKRNIFNALFPSNDWTFDQRNKAYINGSYIPIPCHATGNCVFGGYPNMDIRQAEIITMYYGQQHYCSWDEVKKCWRFNDNNYVKQICDQLPPTSEKCSAVTQPNYECATI